jgi:hypothetical protein
MSGELQAYALLLLVGFLPNEFWRMLGLLIVHGLDEDSEFFMWARAVAIAVLAGVIAKIIGFPPGALAAGHSPRRHCLRLSRLPLAAPILVRRRRRRRDRAHARRAGARDLRIEPGRTSPGLASATDCLAWRRQRRTAV